MAQVLVVRPLRAHGDFRAHFDLACDISRYRLVSRYPLCACEQAARHDATLFLRWFEAFYEQATVSLVAALD